MKCPVCESELIGRIDKKFCSAKCKSINQYQKRQVNEVFYLKVDRQLRTNRKILKRFNHKGYTTVGREEVHSEGFDPRYFTHYWKNKQGDVYLFVYEYGFLDLKKKGKEKYLIVEWQDYMQK